MRIKELFDLKNRVAIITGSSSGLGYHMAEGLADAGSDVVIAARRYDLCRKIADDFHTKFEVDVLALNVDVTQEEDIANMVGQTVDHFGKIDILVNNVGKAHIKETQKTSLSEWNEILALNVNSMFLCSREVGNHMIEKGYGKIINIASVYGIRGIDWRNYVTPEKTRELLSYSTSKGAVINFTRDLAVNWARYNITVNTISPGCFFTEETRRFTDDYTIDKLKYRFPLGRWGDNDDLKGAVVFLASDASKYVTGHNLVVDGGWSAWC
jgi:NAD(P)-dependent dehydrogenase (short-subunit alcohol dehydrogenase family)